jgi:hypothetical protein
LPTDEHDSPMRPSPPLESSYQNERDIKVRSSVPVVSSLHPCLICRHLHGCPFSLQFPSVGWNENVTETVPGCEWQWIYGMLVSSRLGGSSKSSRRPDIVNCAVCLEVCISAQSRMSYSFAILDRNAGAYTHCILQRYPIHRGMIHFSSSYYIAALLHGIHYIVSSALPSSLFGYILRR